MALGSEPDRTGADGADAAGSAPAPGRPDRDADRHALPFAHHHAFLIGIDAYEHVTPLHTAVNDARALADTLAGAQHFLVHPPLLNASGAAIHELLRTTLANEVGPNDRVFFYFAAHGIAFDGEGGPAGYIAPTDADAADIRTFIPMSTLRQALEALPCRHLLLVLDCCFAGAFKWSSNTRDIGSILPKTIFRERFDRYVQDPAWQVITSAAYDQKALDIVQGRPTGARGPTVVEDGRPHSPFARALFQGIAGAADLKGPTAGNGIITATELYSYIRDQVEPESIARGQRDGQQLRQTPGFFPLSKHDKGEYIFLDPHNRLNLPPIPDRSPYKGLASFDEADQQLFYGRERVIAEMRSRYAGHRLLVVTGASGTGKSSVIKAGLLPRLRAAGYRILPVIRPGEHPLAMLGQAIEAAHAGDPTADPGGPNAAPTAATPARKCILIIDQYEEMITRCGDEAERRSVDARLRELLDGDDCIHQIILTVRSDFEPLLNGGALKDHWSAGRCTVPPFTLDELRAVVVMPTTQEVLVFDPPSLVDEIITEVVQAPGALPLLSYALSELYAAYRTSGRQDRALTREDYDKLGGVIGALRTKADALYGALGHAERNTMRRIMLRMVSVEGDLAGKRVRMDDLDFSDEQAPVVAAVVDRLVESRLIVRNEDSIEPAHDALVRAWKALRDWIFEVGKDKLILGAKLGDAAAEYARSADADYLWNSNPNLPVVQSELKNSRHWFNAKEVAFIQKSVRRRKRRAVVAWSGAAVIFAALSVAAWIAEADKIAARKSALDAEVRSLLFASKSQLGVDNDLALLLALEGAGSRPLSEIQKVIDEELDVRGQLLLVLSDPGTRDVPRRMTGAAWEPNGARIATVSYDDEMARVWESKTGQLLARCATRNWNQVAWNPKGRFFAVAGRWAHVTEVLDSKSLTVGSGECAGLSLEDQNGPAFYVEHMAWSPDGQCLVTAQADGRVRVWRSTDDWRTMSELAQEGLQTKVRPAREVHDAEWDFAGDRLLTASDDGTARVWDVSGCSEATNGGATRMQSRLIVPSGGPAVSAAVWSPQGDRFVMLLADDTAGIRDASSGNELAHLTGHRGPLNGAAWDAAGRRIVTASSDGSARIWDAFTGALLMNLSAHSGRVTFAGWGADDIEVVTASDDRTVRTWMAASGKQRALMMHQGILNSVAWSPDKQLIVTASADGFARIWDPEMRAPPPSVEFDIRQDLNRPFYSPDQTHILSVGVRDGRAVVWDARGDSKPFFLHVPGKAYAHAGGALGGGWNPRGDRLVTAGRDGMVRIWSAATHELAVEFRAVEQGDVKEANETAALGAPLWSPQGDPASEHGDLLLTSGNDHQVKIWRLGDSGPIGKPLVFPNGGRVVSTSWSPDGTQVVVTSDRRPFATLWDVEHGTPRELYEPGDTVWSSAWNRDGKWFATAGNDRQVIIYPSGGGSPLRVLFHPAPVRAIAWNSLGTLLATGSEDKVLRIWKISGGEPREYKGYGAEIRMVAWSPDDRLILATGGDNTAVIWNAASGLELPVLTGHTGIVNYAVWDETATQVLTTGSDGVARVHVIDWTARRDAACARVTRNLSKPEWRLYLGNDDWHETCPGKYDP